MQYQTWLTASGVTNAQILSVNFEELEYEELLDYKKLYAYLKEFLTITGIDEEHGFAEYMKCGGLPYIARMDRTIEKVEICLEGIRTL